MTSSGSSRRSITRAGTAFGSGSGGDQAGPHWPTASIARAGGGQDLAGRRKGPLPRGQAQQQAFASRGGLLLQGRPDLPGVDALQQFARELQFLLRRRQQRSPLGDRPYQTSARASICNVRRVRFSLFARTARRPADSSDRESVSLRACDSTASMMPALAFQRWTGPPTITEKVSRPRTASAVARPPRSARPPDPGYFARLAACAPGRRPVPPPVPAGSPRRSQSGLAAGELRVHLGLVARQVRRHRGPRHPAPVSTTEGSSGAGPDDFHSPNCSAIIGLEPAGSTSPAITSVVDSGRYQAR